MLMYVLVLLQAVPKIGIMICSIIEEKEAKKRNSQRAEREKERRRNRQPSKRQKRLNVENKRKQGEKKRMRSRPRFEKE